MYCFKCGDKAHIAKDCTVQDLKCDIHPNSKSHNKIACYIYRKANNLPVRNKSPQDRPSGPNPTAPASGNGANLVMAEDDDEVDTRDIYTDDESDEETNAVELSDFIDEVDKQGYHTESGSDSENNDTTNGCAPPTPPRPREDSAYRVILDEEIPVDFNDYYTESEDKEEC